MTTPAPAGNHCKRCRHKLVAPEETATRLDHKRIQIYAQALWLQCWLCGTWNPAPSELQAILRAFLAETPVSCCLRKD